MYIYLICRKTNSVYRSKSELHDKNARLLEITNDSNKLEFWANKLNVKILKSYKKPKDKVN